MAEVVPAKTWHRKVPLQKSIGRRQQAHRGSCARRSGNGKRPPTALHGSERTHILGQKQQAAWKRFGNPVLDLHQIWRLFTKLYSAVYNVLKSPFGIGTMKYAFFFGAGASACVDMPTTDEMLEFLRNDDRFKVLERSVEFKNIEEVYTYVESLSNPLIKLFMAEQNNKQSTELEPNEQSDLHNDIGKLNDPIIKWQKKYKDKIHKHLVERLNPKRRDVREYNALLTKLWEIDGNLKIITTNYDLLLDESLDGDWSDGFRPNIHGGPIKKWNDQWDSDPPKPILVKLHGSINWKDDSGHRKPKNRGIYKHKSPIQGSMMLPLTLKDKEYGRDPYKGMLAKFRQIIAEVDLCVVIGYRFRDQQILDTIQKHLQSNLHVLLLSPEAKDVTDEWFENTTELIINEENSDVNCNARSGSRVYWCNIRFDSETIDAVLKIIGHVSETIGDNGIDSQKPSI